MKKMALGLMSGTSADGISIAAGIFSGRTLETAGYRTYPYPAPLKQKVLRAAVLRTPELSRLHFELGHFFAKSTRRFLKQTRLSPSQIAVIGSHGQTVYHAPSEKPPHTLQLGEPSFLAEAFGVPVISDFRPRDIAAGGEGAPLIPFFDVFFFGAGAATAMQNIGGIGNVTLVGRHERLRAFDTGPGNVLMDLAMRKITRGKSSCDTDGRLAAAGKPLARILSLMKRHPYFKRLPPKSTGPELFGEDFIPRTLWKASPEDILATLTCFTAWSIADSYRRFLPKSLARVIVSGGGAFNPTLMRFLKETLSPVRVLSCAALGMHPQAKEPLAFAFFALRALEGKINHAPWGTGARRACILGKITPAGF